jgi:hypothetical protein
MEWFRTNRGLINPAFVVYAVPSASGGWRLVGPHVPPMCYALDLTLVDEMDLLRQQSASQRYKELAAEIETLYRGEGA